MSTAIDVFQEFKADHRRIRDLLLDLAAALRARDLPQARRLLGTLNEVAGPHFRFEEESLYPALRPFFSSYVDKLYRDHDGAIETARRLVELVSREQLSEEEAEEGARAAQSLLIHVSDCDGLAVIMERMPEQDIQHIAERIAAARAENLPLLQWAEQVRTRPAAS
jgi:hypothetical protein